MATAAVGFVVRYGTNVPSWDDWDMVPTWTGAQPVTLDWLWSQHNEHRVPVPRLLLLALGRLAAPDFRVAMLFDVLAMCALAAALIVAARRLRGGVTEYADAFFPLVVLHWGQAANLLWGWQLQFFASALLAGMILLLVVRHGPVFEPRRALAVGACLALLPLCGANGLALAPAMAVWLGWLGYGAVTRSETARQRAGGLLVLGIAGAALLLVALYFVGYERVPYHPTSAGPRATLKTSIQFLSIGLGPAARFAWPLSFLIVPAFLIGCAVVLVRTAQTRPNERVRALGLLGFLAAMGSLALGLGQGRNGFEPRYVTLALPVWCAAYFVLCVCGNAGRTALARQGLFVIALLLLWPNTRHGLAYAQELSSHLRAFERDMMAGVPAHQLIARYRDYLSVHDDVPSDYLPLLQQANAGRYRHLRSDPPFRPVAVPLAPTAVHAMRWQNHAGYATASPAGGDGGGHAFAMFSLPRETYVCGIRLRYANDDPAQTLPFVGVYWRGEHNGFSEARFRKSSPTGDRICWRRVTWPRRNDPDIVMTVWVCEPIKQIRVHPDLRPGAFHLREIVLLLAPANEKANGYE